MPKLDLTRAMRIKTLAGEALRLKGPGFEWQRPGRLQPFYASGAILIHMSSNGVSPPGGPATGIANQGGAGGMFDATVVGAPIPLSGDLLVMSSAAGTPTLAMSANLIDVRLMWVSTVAASNGMRYFGDADVFGGTDDYEVRLSVSGSSFAMQLYDSEGGTAAAITLMPRVPAPAGLHLFELEIGTGTGQARAWMDGVQIGQASWTGAFENFYVRRIGQGAGAGNQFVGSMGDILGIVLGRPDTASAIAAARAHLNERFTLGLAL